MIGKTINLFLFWFHKVRNEHDKKPKDMYINATDLFGITESYSKKPDNLPTPLISKVMPKINMIHPSVDIVFIA